MITYRLLEIKEKRKQSECLRIRNIMETRFFLKKNRTHVSFEELKRFIEGEAAFSEEIYSDLMYLNKHDTRHWKW